MPIPPQPPPPDFEDQLRAAILEAEQHARARPTEAARFYAMGLRVAAGLYGMVEGVDPATRTRRLAGVPAAAGSTAAPADPSGGPFYCGVAGPEHQHTSPVEANACNRSRRPT